MHLVSALGEVEVVHGLQYRRRLVGMAWTAVAAPAGKPEAEGVAAAAPCQRNPTAVAAGAAAAAGLLWCVLLR